MTENLCVLCFKHGIVYEMEDFFIYQSNNLLIGNELFILIFFLVLFFWRIRLYFRNGAHKKMLSFIPAWKDLNIVFNFKILLFATHRTSNIFFNCISDLVCWHCNILWDFTRNLKQLLIKLSLSFNIGMDRRLVFNDLFCVGNTVSLEFWKKR